MRQTNLGWLVEFGIVPLAIIMIFNYSPVFDPVWEALGTLYAYFMLTLVHKRLRMRPVVKKLFEQKKYKRIVASAHCRGTTAGVHAKGESRSIRFSVPADANPRTVKIYFSSVHAAVTVTAQVSDGSSPNWVNGDWDATTGSITPVATLSYSAASPNQTLSVTVAVAAGNDWPSVGIHAVTLKAGATATPPPPKPPAPTGVYASAGNGRVIVQWDQMPRVDRYSIYRSPTSSLPSTPWRTNILPIQDNRDTHMLVAADTAATNGTTWHYWVSSITAGGRATKQA